MKSGILHTVQQFYRSEPKIYLIRHGESIANTQSLLGFSEITQFYFEKFF